jgi:REP element-mobilizing transposase RayT
MGRLARVVAADVPHHLTQRGNGRRFVLDCDADRSVYLKLLRENLVLYKVSLIGYCLMSNHIHLIAVPHTADGLAQALKQTHGRYASYWNAAHQSSGHVWQGRYYSCPLDEPHLWEALRYTELNPKGGIGPGRRILALVERGQPLRHATYRGLASSGDVAKPLGLFGMAELSCSWRIGIPACCHSPTHPHRPAAGQR